MNKFKLFCLTAALAVIAPLARAAEVVVTEVNEAATEVVANPDVYTIDFGPLVEAGVPIIFVLIAALLLQGIRWVSKKIGVEKMVSDEQIKKLLDKVIEEGTAYGVAQVKKKGDLLKVETKNKTIATAAAYVQTHAPELLEKSGYDAAKLKEKLEAKLLKYNLPEGK